MCYKGKLSIPMKPLVMLFGENNSGKTAVIKALQFAHFTAASNGEPFTLGGNLDALGSFKGLRHRLRPSDDDGKESNDNGMHVGASFSRVRSKPSELDRLIGSSTKQPAISDIDIDWIVTEAHDGTLKAEVSQVVVNQTHSIPPPLPESSLYFLLSYTKASHAWDEQEASLKASSDHSSIPDLSDPAVTLKEFVREIRERTASPEVAEMVLSFASVQRRSTLGHRPLSKLVSSAATILAPYTKELREVCRLHFIYYALRHMLGAALNIGNFTIQTNEEEWDPDRIAEIQDRTDSLEGIHALLDEEGPFSEHISQGILSSRDDYQVALAEATSSLKHVLATLDIPHSVLVSLSYPAYGDFKSLERHIIAYLFGLPTSDEGLEEAGRHLGSQAFTIENDLAIGSTLDDLLLLDAVTPGDEHWMAVWIESYLWSFPRGMCLQISSHDTVLDYRSDRSDSIYNDVNFLHPIGNRFQVAGDIIKATIKQRNTHLYSLLLHPREAIQQINEMAASVFDGSAYVQPTRAIGSFYYEDDVDKRRGVKPQSRFDSAIDIRGQETAVNDLLRLVTPGLSLRSRLIDGMPVSAYAIEFQEGNGPWVSIAHSGSGLSQVVPILHCLINEVAALKCIQQPELHLHPKMQASLMEVIFDQAVNQKTGSILELASARRLGLASSAQERALAPSIVVESHSELMVLRLKRLLRRSFNAGKKGLSQKVALLYVNRSGSASNLQQIPLSDEGVFQGDWPGGFFSERLEELL